MEMIMHPLEIIALPSLRIPSPPRNPLPAMSEKIASVNVGCSNSKKLKWFAWGTGGLIVFIGLLVFVVFLVLHPSKPSFNLEDVTVYQFNVSKVPPYAINIIMQVTLSSRNPNSRIGVEYQPLHVYATYRDQQITMAYLLPPTYQGHKEPVVWSPPLTGYDMPISPYSQQSLDQDWHAGVVLMNIKLQGDVKWKVGTWISPKYHLYVHCPANIRFGRFEQRWSKPHQGSTEEG
ncbi:NDR1/HIN1-Like protein 3-like [Prunus yedoensis var. nudiflora]|uniref:NDR1/HIN1-Like protein 3-like n=1 Tax=Prunus yedoensis var. nudiflora TaxID=2094558 RepID=A0A314Z1N0_PRUYE|nr:NDR1/HIN1-Like protein 3-like [Prunus yedoensis var. nudiflora]